MAENTMQACPAQPLVSIVIPAYNGEQHVARAIESALNQTMKLVEVVVVDDGSTDGTPEVLKRYHGTIKIVRQKNKGVAGARNTGIRESVGKYICFIDQDDTYLPRKCEQQSALLEKHPEAGLCYGIWYPIDPRDGSIVTEYRPGDGLFERTSGPFPPHFQIGAAMFRREWLYRVGGQDESFRFADDTDLRFRLWAAGCAFLPIAEPSSTWTLRAGSESSIGMWTEHLRALERHFDVMGDAIDREKRNSEKASTYLIIGINHLKSGSVLEASEAWRSALSYQRDIFASYMSWLTVLNRFDPNHPLPVSDWFPNCKQVYFHLMGTLRGAHLSESALFSSNWRKEGGALSVAMSLFASYRNKPMIARSWALRSLLVSPLSLASPALRKNFLRVMLGPNLSRLVIGIMKKWRRLAVSGKGSTSVRSS